MSANEAFVIKISRIAMNAPNTPPINTYHDNTFRCQEGDSGMCPTSNHPGGVNVSFMDGSVHFVKSTVSNTTWWALGTINGGEVISSDSY